MDGMGQYFQESSKRQTAKLLFLSPDRNCQRNGAWNLWTNRASSGAEIPSGFEEEMTSVENPRENMVEMPPPNNWKTQHEFVFLENQDVRPEIPSSN